MKNKIAAISLAILAIATPLAARADLIFYEGFNYPDGNITNVSSGVWSNFSGGLHDMLVVNHQLQVGSTGGTLSRSDDDNRLLGAPYSNAPTVLYASFTVICTNLPTGGGNYFAAFYSTLGGFSGRIQSLTNGATLPNSWRLGASGNASATNANNGGLGVDLALNTPYQVVARLDPVNALNCTVWINPISENDPSYNSGHESLGFAVLGKTNINAFAFRQASAAVSPPANNWFSIITNLALATTFDEALTNVQPTNAVPPVFAVSPQGITNFIGIPATVFGIANGQGQMNMTYAWFKNGQPYNNNIGAVPNELSFGSPQTSDNGSYVLVASNIYGLSVTSAPAMLSFSAQPVAPKITSGPDSTNLFVGQAVTFAVQVASPGNLSYQWKSNNVNILGATDSTLTISNVQVSYSGNYSVGVTNDVFPTGVVSSNAVLTVSNATQVTVAFLRSLVDRTTFLPDIAPVQPFTTTGVITTFTNTTSGNTTSGFLQDATGGINIFVTFGDSTATNSFRPSRGDVVTFTGVLSSFSTTGLELAADTNNLTQTTYTIISNNAPLPTPIVIPYDVTNTANLTNVALNIAGSLVKLTNVFFGTNAGTTISTTVNEKITVTNASGQSFSLQFFDVDLDTAAQTLPVFASSVTGVLYGLHPSYSVAVTKFSDIDTNVVVIPISLSAQLTGGSLTLNWSDSSFVLQESTNVNGIYTNVPGASSPFPAPISGSAGFFRLLHGSTGL